MLEMIIEAAKIKGQARKIRALGQKVSNRTYVITLNESKGEMADELRNMEKSLQSIGASLISLTEATSDQLDKAAEDFMKMDNRIAGWFRGKI